jgi:hypothetical protein
MVQGILDNAEDCSAEEHFPDYRRVGSPDLVITTRPGSRRAGAASRRFPIRRYSRPNWDLGHRERTHDRILTLVIHPGQSCNLTGLLEEMFPVWL